MLTNPLSLFGGVLSLLILGTVFILDARSKRGGADNQAGLGGWLNWKGRLSHANALKFARDRLFDGDEKRQKERGIKDSQLVAFFGHPLNKVKERLYMQLEDACLVIGPARSGKSIFFVMRRVAEAVGPAVNTSTKLDVFTKTWPARARMGEVWVYDPQGLLPDDVPVRRLKWNPLFGCEDPETALRRSEAWAGAQPMNGVKGGDWFNRRGAVLLSKLLHAAALGENRDVLDVKHWGTNLSDRAPRMILEESGPRGWAGDLDALATNKAGETTGSITMSLDAILDCLNSPNVVDTVTPGPEEHFDVTAFLQGRNTLYLLASEQAGATMAPLFTMLVDEILHTASRLSQTHEAGFLWPPLRFVGDEIAQLAPLEKLPQIMADSGGRGIQVDAVAQSYAQLVNRWGKDAAEAILSTAAMRLYLPGIREEKLSNDLARIAGKKKVRTTSTSRQERGGTSRSTSTQKEDRITADMLRELSVGQAWMEYRTLKIGKVKMTPWTDTEGEQR